MSSLVKHLIPTMGLRFEFLKSGKSAAISSDTEPVDAMVRLANGVDVLFHEATGATMGHSSAAQAGEIAQRAGARSLWLIHYKPGESAGSLVAQAAKNFSGLVYLAKDLEKIELS
jgi:ribonuclease Z